MNLAEEVDKLSIEVESVIQSSDKNDTLPAHLKKIKSLFGLLKELPPESRPEIASKLNLLREKIETVIGSAKEKGQQKTVEDKLKSQYFDLTLPGRSLGLGHAHPITRTERRILSVIKSYGFRSILGPEIETEYYCFDALNIPKHHPARDMQDTFYTDSDLVLRTHTTSVSARALEGSPLPVKVASFGRVYRNETEDASHQAMFHQFDLIWIEEGLTLAHLMGLITEILHALYGKKRKVRFVPKFYPYTEPSIGPQIDCTLCKQRGCAACGESGWVTVAGAGMMHRNVLLEFKYDPEKVGGFAFGLGTSRLAAQFFDFNTLRSIYENDLRVLRSLA